ncbi:MAG: hydantoinase [Planctomycetaceae bacterium]|nr:hydantoinase [Planctomycetaceae bacterium]
MKSWEFWIDVGGTFTDCIARDPHGELRQLKVLSSGITKGKGQVARDRFELIDLLRVDNPPGFWVDFDCRLLNTDGDVVASSTVTNFDASTGTITLAEPLANELGDELAYELTADIEAPILAIRYLLHLGLSAVIPPVDVRLGTTRGTNALLTRNGAKTAFVTTNGFADVLLIGNQDRPRLFDLEIKKPEPIFSNVIEIDERIDAEGRVLKTPDESEVRAAFESLKQTDVESIAICLLHSFANPDHEAQVERLAREVGFDEISTSSKLSPLIKIVSRGDTTVMDAYLNPILREYVGGMRRALGSSQLRMMTSAGGLVDANRFVGKDSILSGPAGGVIGFSRVAEKAGFPKSIGFDMGGTSTDVSRYDGSYELEFETQKAGVRIVAPMLAVETVAAGGGSICGFDGVKLHVGPQSAGADPGPACYGRGGPLTVTDINLYLGRLLPERFPFPLDREAVESRLAQLCEEIANSPLGKSYTPMELADGFCRIANANMVRAIRKISVAKGYDPADYALVTFGGAGAQHACAIARLLGANDILLHPFAGILSAYGIGLADVRRHQEQSVLKPYCEETLNELEATFATLETTAKSEVLSEGVLEERLRPTVYSLDMRYKGVESTINVVRPDDGDYAARYEELHEQLYGYRHSGRDIEITVARVEVIGVTMDPPDDRRPLNHRQPDPAETTKTWFDGVEHDTSVFDRCQLQPGDEIHGPAIICEPTSTVLVEPEFVANIAERQEVHIRRDVRGEGSQNLSADTSVDPVQLEIFNNLFASIAEQMGITLQQTSVSTNVKERLDFSCAIFDPVGDLVVNAPHIPVHLGAMSETVKRVISDNPEISAGDVFVTNDPYRGGSHLPDITVVTPVHNTESGELLFFTASRAHHAEVGGIVPGSVPPFSKNLAEEGVLIRNFKLVDGGDSREAAFRELLLSGKYPTRSVADNLVDVAAQVAANNNGVGQLRELVARYSLPVVQAYMQHIQDAAAEKMRMALRAIPDGKYTRTEHLDDGSPLVVSIQIQDDRAVVDFTGTGPVIESNLNANSAILRAAVLYVFRCLIDEDIPLNSGVLKPVDIVLPECFLNPPERESAEQCAAVVGGNVETSSRVVDTLLGALEVAAASQGTMNNLTFGDEQFGYYETICGGSGATESSDGASAVHTHMTNTRLTDVEVIERRYPVRVHEFSIRRGSGGPGKHQGGDGIIRRIEFLRPLKVSILSERRGDFAPFGLRGGGDGKIGENTLIRAGQSTPENIGGKVALEANAGDELTLKTPGGGGYREREP